MEAFSPTANIRTEDLYQQIADLRQALSTAGVGSWHRDLRSDLVYCDERCRELYGFGAAEAVPYQKVLQGIHPDDREGVRAAVAAALRGENGGYYEMQFRTAPAADGSWRWLHSKARCDFDETGAALRFRGTTQDVTEVTVSRFNAGRAAELAGVAVEGAGAGTFLISLPSDEIQYSPAFKKILTGNPEGSFSRADFIRYIHPDDAPLREAAYAEALKTGKLYYEARSVWDDGSIHWIKVNGAYARDLAGNFTVFSGICQDFTEQKLARQALERSELFSRSVIMNSPVAKVILIGADLRVLMVNEKMCELFGLEAGLSGLPLEKAVPAIGGTDMLTLLQEVFRSGETVEVEEACFSLPQKDGAAAFYLSHRHRPLRNEAGEIYGIISTWIDVSRQVEARKEILATQTVLSAAVETAQLATWEFLPEGEQLKLSPRMLYWLGFEDTEQPTAEAILSTLAKPSVLRHALAAALRADGDGLLDVEYLIRNRKTGEARYLRSRGQVYSDGARGRVLVGTSQDVTLQRKVELSLEREVQERTEALAAANEELGASNEELAQANEQLIHSNEELAQYAYVASHDLQEPLRKIRMFGDMLTTKGELGSDSLRLVQKICRSSERMTLLIRDLLEFSRLLQSDSPTRPVDLNETLAEIVDDFELSIAEKGAVLRIEKLPVIEAVGLQMNQLFYNLMSNALKFSRPGVAPQIGVSCRPASEQELGAALRKPAPGVRYYSIRFADNGIGFEPQFSEQIFEVFKRLHGRDIYPGSGIGLALCRRIAANHQGALTTVSTPGAGATFTILLPELQRPAQNL